MSRILLLERSHKNLGSATSHLFSLICIGFRFAIELALKLLRLLSGCYNFNSPLILHLSSHDMYRHEHSALHLLSICVPHIKPPWQPPNNFHLLLREIWNALPNHLSSIPTLPAFRRALKHHLFLLAHPDNSAKSGKIKPAQCIILRDAVPTNHHTARKYHAAHLKAFHLSAFDFFFTIFVSSHMYHENPEGTQVILGSMNMRYISDTARNRTHNLFRPKRKPIPLGHTAATVTDTVIS